MEIRELKQTYIKVWLVNFKLKPKMAVFTCEFVPYISANEQGRDGVCTQCVRGFPLVLAWKGKQIDILQCIILKI